MTKLRQLAAIGLVVTSCWQPRPAHAFLPIVPFIAAQPLVAAFLGVVTATYAAIIYGIDVGISNMGPNTYTFSGALKLPENAGGTAPCPNGSLAGNPNLGVLLELAAINCRATLEFGLTPGPGCSLRVESASLPGVCMVDGTVNNASKAQCQALVTSCNAIWPGQCTGNCPQE